MHNKVQVEEKTLKELIRHADLLKTATIKDQYIHWNNLLFAISTLYNQANLENQTDSFIWPMKGRISSPFGEKRTNSKGQVYYHTGIDIADNPSNKTPIGASADGEIIRASSYGGYGNCIDIKHSNSLITRYAHCSVLKVNVGDKVKQGQQIAVVGSTGHSTGPHLHFEVIKDGKVQNPLEYLQERK